MRTAFDKIWYECLLFKLSEHTLSPSIVVSQLLHRECRRKLFFGSSCHRRHPSSICSCLHSVSGVHKLFYSSTRSNAILILIRWWRTVPPQFDEPGHASAVLQRQLDILMDWMRRWRQALTTEKSEAICFLLVHDLVPIPFSLTEDQSLVKRLWITWTFSWLAIN